MLRTGGSIGVTAWGRDAVARAAQIWDEELDRYAAARESPVVARHELMNTQQKLQALLEGAGFARARAEFVPWSHHANLAEFVALHSEIGVAGRRFAGLEPRTRTDFSVRCGRGSRSSPQQTSLTAAKSSQPLRSRNNPCCVPEL